MSGEINRRLMEILQRLEPDVMAKEAHTYLKDITPFRTGYAKRNTKHYGDRVYAQYKYAGRLDQGASDQAEDGLIQPTFDHMREWIGKQ